MHRVWAVRFVGPLVPDPPVCELMFHNTITHLLVLKKVCAQHFQIAPCVLALNNPMIDGADACVSTL